MLLGDVLHGLVTITWPSSRGNKPLPSWLVAIHDAESGEQIVDAVSMKLTIGTEGGWNTGPIGVELVRLVGDDGEPIGTGRPVMSDAYRAHAEAKTDEPFDGPAVRTGVFKYVVVGMRTAGDEMPERGM